MEQLVATWQEASALAVTEKEEAIDPLLKEYSAITKQQVRDVEGWYKFVTANENFQALAQARYEHNLTLEAWNTAEQVIAEAKKVLEADPAPPQPKPNRPHRPSQRKRRVRSRA